MIYTDPYEYDEAVQPLVSIYEEVEDEILTEIAKLLSADKNAGTMAWYINRLAQTRRLDKTVLKILASKAKMTQEAVKSAVFESLTMNLSRYHSTLQTARKQGLFGREIQRMSESELRERVNEISQKLQDDSIKKFNETIQASTAQTYKSAIGNIFTTVASKVKTFMGTLVDTLRNIGKHGIPAGVFMREGKPVRVPIDTQIKREVVNQLVQESNRLMLERCEKDEIGYVEISAHMGARTGKKGFHPTIENPDPTNHAWWQGKVYKIHGEDDKYPNLIRITGYGTITGLCGINCRHHMFPFIPGVSESSQPRIDEKENARIYELTQQQRYLERQVRSAKRQYEMIRYSGDDEAIKKSYANVRKKEKELSDFLKANKKYGTYIYRQPDRVGNGLTRYELDIQMFAEKDLRYQKLNQLEKGIKSLQKRVEEHQYKIQNPELFDMNWGLKSEQQRNGMLKYWQKEISRYEKEIQERMDEIERRKGNE